MADARVRMEWAETSSMMALIANCNRVKGRAFRPDDFNPYAPRRPAGTPLTADNIGLLKQLAGGRRK